MLRPKKIRLVLALAIVLAGVSLIVAVVVKVDHEGGTADKPVSMPDNVDMALQKVHYSEVRDGVTKWDLFADSALLDKKKDNFHLHRVRLVLAAEKKTGSITLTADEAEYDTQSKDVELVGNVVAKSDSGLQFTTERASYIASRALIKTSSPVRFTNGNFAVRGIGMEFMTASRDLRIMKDVSADIKTGPAK